MSCQNFDKAVHYAKAAFKDALETEELKDETLNLLFHYYQGLKSIRDEMPKHDRKEEAGPIFLSDGIGDISFTPDVNMEDYIQFNSEVDYGETLE
tara:strand:- start:396 stop:680 length:285 start_codon:yes stop_codon:yes gene_type:complete